MERFSHVRMFVMALAASFVVVLVLSVPANAAVALDPNYTAQTLKDGGGNEYRCQTWSAGSDAAGAFYIPCFTFIAVVTPDGKLRKIVDLPDQYDAVRDAAPSHDGKYIYWITGDVRHDFVAAYPNTGHIRRMKRNADGSYSYDPTFHIPRVDFGGGPWSARNLDVDRNGHIYFSVNAYVFEYSSTGVRLASFGGDENYQPGGCGADTDCTSGGGLEIAEGVAVHPNGNSIYVVDQKHHHVQRWDRTGATWTRSGWVLGNPLSNKDGAGQVCQANNVFSSPYDVGLDGHGSIYVMDTTCDRIQKFRASDGAFQGSVYNEYTDNNGNGIYDAGDLANYRIGPAEGWERSHGIAVNYRGQVVLPGPNDSPNYRAQLFSPKVESTVCGPDGEAPVVTGSSRTRLKTERAISLRVAATDRCSAVTHIRVEYQDTTGVYRDFFTSGFKPVKSSYSLLLKYRGKNNLRITVRDAYGRTAEHYRSWIGVPGTTAGGSNPVSSKKPKLRKKVKIWGKGKYCVKRPLKSIGNARRYRVLDRCARVKGRVISVKKRGNTVTLKIQTGKPFTRKVWTNSPKGYKLYALGTKRVRGLAKVKRGHKVTLTGAVLVNRKTGTVNMAPVGHVKIRR